MVLTKISLCKSSLVLSALLLLSACSSSKNQVISDPYENINRKVFSFNNGIDKVILKPAAKVYKFVTPNFLDRGVGNFFSNLGDVTNVFNNALQGKLGAAGSDTGRFAINTTLGIAGFFDVASTFGLDKHNEDFGQTLAVWGVKSGPYLMVPFLGPSTIRDVVAQVTVDNLTDPANYTDASVALFVLETVKTRADFFGQEQVVRGLSDDTYSALRDVWIQNRQTLIRDGKADEKADSELIDELESLDSL